MDLNSQTYSYRETVNDRKNIYIYKTYNDKTLRDDIAMIKLPVAIPKFDSSIGLIALPRNYTSEKFVGANGTVVSYWVSGH